MLPRSVIKLTTLSIDIGQPAYRKCAANFYSICQLVLLYVIIWKNGGCKFNWYNLVNRINTLPALTSVSYYLRLVIVSVISSVYDPVRGNICLVNHPPSYENTLRWRHNECNGVSNHQPRDCLFSRLFRRRSKKTSKLRVTGLCEGNSPVTGEFPAQRTSNAENVSIWWRHHQNSHSAVISKQSDSAAMLQWRHNERRLFRRRSKKHQSSAFIGLC